MKRTVGKRIVILSYDFHGAVIHDRAEMEWKLARDGHSRDDSFLIISWSKRRETIRLSERITVESFRAFAGSFRPLYDFLFIFVAPYVVRQHGWKPDTIAIAELPLALAAAAVRAFSGGSVVVRLIGLPRELARMRSFLHFSYAVLAETLLKRIPDHYMVINEATRNYVERLHIPGERISVMPADSIGIDGDMISSVPRGEARKELGISGKTPLVLSVGRLEPEKAFDELIRLFLDSGTEARLVILGEGVLRARLEELIRTKGGEGKVTLAGRKGRRDVWKYYKDADAFALVSKTEGIGLVFWEAIVAGVPVIGRPVGGVKETIGEDGLRGFLWKEGDGAAVFGERLARCIAKDAEVRAMMERASAFVRERLAEVKK
ncbi:MAG: glycosyltransferase [Patescibacteria group bacterium]|nr:glycosyltransferase [Patescibacteria group bacterium]